MVALQREHDTSTDGKGLTVPGWVILPKGSFWLAVTNPFNSVKPAPVAKSAGLICGAKPVCTEPGTRLFYSSAMHASQSAV